MSSIEQIEFCDLSSDLDRLLKFLAHLSENANHPSAHEAQEGYGEFLWDYLGKRAALEHVFFNRTLTHVEWDELKLKAEIWRIRKIRARLKLPLQSEKKSK